MVRLFLSLLGLWFLFGTMPARADFKFYDPNTQTWVTYRPSPEAAGKLAKREYRKKIVSYHGNEAPGTIVIDTKARYLYLVKERGKAMRYGIGVGRDGFTWKGTQKVTRMAKWPGWTPPPEMIARERKNGRHLPAHMKGGPDNPLGARALYLGNTIYRIHGTNEDWSIGHAVSSGCIRMFNEDVKDLYSKVKVGTTVKVL